MGYHPGAEDDSIYLTSIKFDLHPTLFPHDAAFFQLQMRTSIFDTWMAQFVHFTGISVSWAELIWQFISVFLVVWAARDIISQLFDETAERWAGIAMFVAMFTLPVAGTALYIMDQYLHPRGPATAMVLFGVSRILAGKRWQAVPFVVLAFVLHPLMGALGISFCCVLTLTLSEPLHEQIRSWRSRSVAETPDVATPLASVMPFGWVFNPPSQIWLEIMRSRHWFRLYEWTWYEWLGVVGPLVLFWLIARLARKSGNIVLSRFAIAVLIYGIFQQALAMIVLGPTALIGLSTFEPMRYLHLIYIFLTLVGGAYLGKYVLQLHVWRWALFLLMANSVMFIAQRQLFAATEHLELPGRSTTNPWLQAFEWVRLNTPQNAYFALGPDYMAAPGEDYHSFRALAERSVLADSIKDASVVTKVPDLGPEWHKQTDAQAGWATFRLRDFQRLKNEFGVNWVLVSFPQQFGLDCHWHNETVSVCEIP